jgi:hypothetical protein
MSTSRLDCDDPNTRAKQETRQVRDHPRMVRLFRAGALAGVTGASVLAARLAMPSDFPDLVPGPATTGDALTVMWLALALACAACMLGAVLLSCAGSDPP